MVEASVFASSLWRWVTLASLSLWLLIAPLAIDPASAGADPTVNCATPVGSQAVSAGASPAAAMEDLATIDGMIRLHAQAVALANQGLQHAQDSQVRRLALRVAESQAGEIQLLRSWRAVWFPAPGPLQIDVASPPHCSELPFDEWFLIQMQDQLMAQVTLASDTADTADHAELRDFARSTVEIRTSELRSLDTLLENLSTTATTVA